MRTMHFVGIVGEKAAVLKQEKSKISIESLRHSSDVKQFYNEATVVSGLPASAIFLRKIEIPLKERRKVLAALPFQVEGLLPFPAESVILCPFLQPLSKKVTEVTLLATTTHHLTEHLDGLAIRVDVVSCEPMALLRFALWEFPSVKTMLALHRTAGKTLCIYIEQGRLLLSQVITGSPDEKFIIFLKQKNIAVEELPWIVVGDELLESVFLGSELKVEESLRSFAIPIGLALDAIASDQCSVQFCQKHLIPKQTLLARQKKSLSFLALSSVITIVMILSSSFFLNKKERLLSQKLRSYLPESQLKGEYATADQMEEKIFNWEKFLSKQKSSFPLVSNAPKVSDVLAWLSLHPSLVTEKGIPKEGIEIKSLHYSMLKHPKIGDPSTPYLAQVNLEFTATTPRLARDFHEALLKGDQIVNAKKEVKWQVQNQTYLTSFELKGVTGS